MPFSAQPARVNAQHALPGRQRPLEISPYHFVNQHAVIDLPAELSIALFAMGCFWGAERLFWKQSGVYVTSVGYSGGHTPNPWYKEVRSGNTGHAEVVRVAFDPSLISYQALLTLFWENHNPAQGMRQGNDIGTQYRSAIYTYSAEKNFSERCKSQRITDRLPRRSSVQPLSILRKMSTSSIWLKTLRDIVDWVG
jgi:peptide-methionine (S)-S-oxide reductase